MVYLRKSVFVFFYVKRIAMDGVLNETFMMGIKGSSASKYVYNVYWYLCSSSLEKLLNVFYLYPEVG